MSGLKTKVVHGAFWVLLQRFATQFVSFFVTLILARLLTPSDYGTVALLSIFTSVAGILVDSGFGMALIQKKDATELDFNSIFYVSMAVATICYVLLFFFAPFVAMWYGIPELKWMLRVISIQLFFSAMNSVQGAELSRKMLYHLFFKISLITCFTSAIAGVSLAYFGFGPWAIVGQGVLSGLSGVIAFWFIVAWRPKLMFSWVSVKELFSFGWKVASVGVIHSLYTNAYGLIIGKAYSKEDLAFVNKGHAAPNLAISTISSTICGVSFPALSQMQDDRPRMREAVKRMATCSSFFVFPLMTGIGLCADDLVFVLFGAKWLPCVPYMRLACFSLAIQPFHDINLQAIAAMGRGDVFLKLQLMKTGIGCVIMAVCLSQSVFFFMATMAFVLGPVSFYINSWHNRTFINYSFYQQIRDVLPTAGICSIMAASVCAVRFAFPMQSVSVLLTIAKLTVEGIVGVSIYFALSAFFKIPAFSEYARIPLPFLEKHLPRVATCLKKRII